MSSNRSLPFSPPRQLHSHRPAPISTSSQSRYTSSSQGIPTTTPRSPTSSVAPSRFTVDTNYSSSPSHISHSTTHAGGIQPSASFFRPSRPSQHDSRASPSRQHLRPQLRPISFASGTNTDDDDDGEVVQLSPLGRKTSLSTVATGDDARRNIVSSEASHPAVLVQRPSHENLAADGRPSITREPSGSQQQRSPSSPSSASRNNRSKRARTSLDIVFNFKRGLRTSQDAPPRKSNATSRTSGTGQTSASSAPYDEERATGGYPPSHFKSSSPLTPEHPHTPSLLSSNRDEDDFNPVPPPSHPPLSDIPIPDPKSPARGAMRNYRLHTSRNRFFLDGRILAGGDSPWAFIGSFGVLLSISGVWFGTTCAWWWNEWGGGGKAIPFLGAYGAAIVISTMLTTAFTDPGILPRNLDPDPPYPTTSPSDGGVHAPLPRDLKVRNDIVRVKYCPTCKTYRPPRSSHCKMCDNCVDSCDHHCQWVNNCIGRRNYGTFFALLFSATLTLILVIITTALHLYFYAHDIAHTSFRHALSSPDGIGSAVAFAMSICVIWPVGALLAYHVRLVLYNITTIEQIRNQAHKTLMPGAAPRNPFSHGGPRRNAFAVLCRPRGYSWLDARGIATEDRRSMNPEVAARAKLLEGNGVSDADRF